MTPIHSLITKLPEEIDLISSENLSHRIHIDEDDSNLTPLVHAVNRLADRYEELTADVQQRIQLASAETEEEKNILAAFISELPEGVLICNADGQILLYNNNMGQFTGFIILLNDITRQREADTRVDALLQSLTKSARSPLASVRSAIEAIIEYPDMDTSHLQRFREIIHKESITLSDADRHPFCAESVEKRNRQLGICLQARRR